MGASPQISYRYMLEKLAEKGFLVVATPYNLSFDHLATCDEVLTRFEDLAPTLAREYGALPVVGIGHSCGALLQLLITCLFPDTPRAANALLSFNNKPVTEAVPFFEEFFAPVFTSIATPTQVGNPLTGNRIERPSSNESLVLGLKLAKAATQGVLPSDELLQEAATAFSKVVPFPLPPPPFFPSGGGVVGDMFGSFKNGGRNVNVDSTSSSGGTSGSGATTSEDQEEPVIKIPTELREAYARWAAPSVATLAETGVLPLIHETIISLEQIPKLVDEVSRGDSVSVCVCVYACVCVLVCVCLCVFLCVCCRRLKRVWDGPIVLLHFWGMVILTPFMSWPCLGLFSIDRRLHREHGISILPHP